MNTSIIRFVLGKVLLLEGLLMALPCIVACIYREQDGFYFFAVAIGCVLVGLLLSLRKPKSTVFYLKEGCITTAMSWIVLSVAGCLPFYFSKAIPSFTDALFETISGFTTTGASILSDVECLSHCVLFWRSFTHWVGGMGVLVFLLAIIPMSGGSHINLMRAESPGPSVGKLVPKLKSTARILYIIYLGLTVIETVFLLFGGLPLFDSLTMAFGTAGTGGFGILNSSAGDYSMYIKWVFTVFMILFGVNFNAYYLIIFGNLKKALAMEEVKHYFLIILCSTAFITINIFNTYKNIFDAITDAAFQVASIITTTGFSTTDFDQWPAASKTIIVLLMFVGACAGSTGGGIKVSRFIIAMKTIRKELISYIHPKSIKKIKMDGKPIEHEVVRSVNVYFLTFIFVFCISVFFVSLEGYDFTTNFTAVAATINNIGPGLSLVGPTQNFGMFKPFTKYILMFDMLAGRLELFPLLIMFHPAIWKESFHEAGNRLKKLTNGK